MKQLFRILTVTILLLSVGCIDDDLYNRLDNLEERVSKLEELCREMNTNISSLQAIVTALQTNDYVTAVTPIVEDGKTVGYTISFVKSDPITIYHGKDGKDGADGEDGKDGQDGKDGVDGYTPVIGVRQDSDGIYYWTLDGDWLLDADGNKIKAQGIDGKDGADGKDGEDGKDGQDGEKGEPGEPGAPGQNGQDGKDGQDGVDGKDGADGITPQLKIEGEYWYISYDNGVTWTRLGKATGEDGKDGQNGADGKDGKDGDSFFKSVDTSNEDYVIFTLSDGTQIQLPTWYAFEQLRRMCNEMNTNISALQVLVDAVQNRDYITSCTPYMEDGVQLGYTINFAKGNPIVIYYGKDGADGEDGKDGLDGKDGKDGIDGYTPVIGVRQDSDGIYYWTLDGDWLLDADGNKIKAQGIDGKDGKDGEKGEPGEPGAPGQNGQDGKDGQDGQDGVDGKDGADGITPQLKIEGEYWYISYDNGVTWTRLGKATGEDGKDGQNGQDGKDGKDGDSFFKSVTQDEQNVYFELADGTLITLPKGTALNITFDEPDLVVMSTKSTRSIGYTVSSMTDKVTVEVTSSADIKAKVIPTDNSGMTGSIQVTTGNAIDEYSKVIVFVSNGDKVIMRSITFEEAGLVVEENATKIAPAVGGEVVLEFLTNVKCEASIPEEAQDWISVVPATRAMEKHTITLKLEPNEGAARSAELIVESVDGKLSLTYTISQKPNLDYQLALEREALIAIYNALDGDNWTNNTNWCSDKPVSEWHGITINENGFVDNLSLDNNNLYGIIPRDIAKLSYLRWLILRDNRLIGDIPQWITTLRYMHTLDLSGNKLEGSIPQGLDKMKDLVFISLASNQLSGEIPDDIKNLSKARAIYLSGNKLSGSIPEWVSKFIVSGGGIMLFSNNFTGQIPESVITHPEWVNFWFYIIAGNNFDLTNVVIPAPEFELKDISGNIIKSQQLYNEYEYVIHYQWGSWCVFSEQFTPILVDLTNRYKDYIYTLGAAAGFETMDAINSYNERHSITWDTYQQGADNKIRKSESLGYDEFYPSTIWPSVTVFESKSKTVVFTDVIQNRNAIIDFFEEKFGNIEQDNYTSTDYSQDGVVTTLQTATKGEGIDIVLMGDAYSDRQIADGTYRTDMEYIYNNLFTEEPYKSFKDHFNVYYVNVVSATEGYEYGNTALDGYFGDGTLVGGNDNAVFDYALKAISEEEMDEALLIVAMNSDNYAGTCYMYYPDNNAGYGNGVSVAYFPRGGDATTFAQLLHHEACGHGFAKLADEYAYEYMGAVPSDYISQIQTQQTDWGWWKNVDFTNDWSQIRWRRFLNDSRYQYDGLSTYEGGLTYWSGVWRPTYNSIMRYNTGGFNAPSREAIYYRIHKLAYGDSWQYDYEEFVEWDARNRKAEAHKAPYRAPANFKHTAPPVVINKSWRDAK